LTFAVSKFHKMIYGRKFILQTNHMPLLFIFDSKKGISFIADNRLQRWALILRKYDFSMEYVCTTSIGKVDAMSRRIANRQHDS